MERQKLFLLFLWAVFFVNTAGSASLTCPQGSPGIPGHNGYNGRPGTPGRDGRDAKGERGGPGPKGDRGISISGPKGETGPMSKANWKQCAWKRDDNKDIGLIQECVFVKKIDQTALRVFYAGTLRITGCSGCCKRWYFTFNGAECSPMTIEGVIYLAVSSTNPHRHRHIEGYCTNIPKGKVRVGFWVGVCAGYGPGADAETGWMTVSRIVVEEVPSAQPGS